MDGDTLLIRRRRAVTWLAASQASLIAFLAVCLALGPGVVIRSDERGFSNFGVRAETVVPYTLGLALCSAFLWRAGRSMPTTTVVLRRAGVGLQTTAAAFALALVSTYPYKIDDTLEVVHVVAAILLFVVQLGVVSGLTALVPRSPLVAVAATVWFAGFVVGAATIVGLITLLFAAQAAMSLGFAVVTVTATAKLLAR